MIDFGTKGHHSPLRLVEVWGLLPVATAAKVNSKYYFSFLNMEDFTFSVNLLNIMSNS